MRNLLIIAASLAVLNLSANAQCQNNLELNNLKTTPLPQNYSISQENTRLVNHSNNTYTINSDVNFNNIFKLGFQGKFKVNKVVNINAGSTISYLKLYPNSDVEFSGGFSFGGNSNQTAAIYVESNSTLRISNNFNANNNYYNKFIYLGNNSKLFINNQEFLGDRYYTNNNQPQNPNDTTNSVIIVRCNSIPLNSQTYKFYVDNDKLQYLNTKNVDVQLEYSSNAFNWSNLAFYPYSDMFTYLIKDNGFYRLKIDGKYSEVIKITNIKEDKRIVNYYDFYGKIIKEPKGLYIEYYSDGSSKKFYK